jgi:hypothetical protein
MEEKKKDLDELDKALRAWKELIDMAKNNTPLHEKLDNKD